MGLPDHSVHNDDGKVTIFLQHGIYGAKEYWRFQIQRLTALGYRVVALDAPGYGLSKLPDNLSFDLIAEASASLVRARGGEKNVYFGHSMGGHGALTLALRHPGVFTSVSAFAPICAPSRCPWGHKAFTGYLGADTSAWAAHDASALMAAQAAAPYPAGILVDQGLADKFLADGQLLPEVFEAACAAVGQPLTLRRQPGYDHGYYFVASFIEDHLRHHAARLRG